MKFTTSAAQRASKLKIFAATAVLIASAPYALAQGSAAGPGAVTGDPAASSASTKGSTGETSGMSGSKSGSGSSSSGGSDANGDQGRDKMPDSSVGVRPYDKQNKPAK